MSACWQKPKRKCKTNLNKFGMILFARIFLTAKFTEKTK